MTYNKLIFFFGQLFIFSALVIFNSTSWAKSTITIGLLIDENNKQQKALITTLRKELQLLLGSKYQIKIPNTKILAANWSAKKSHQNYKQLLQDDEVKLIIAAGIIASTVIVSQKKFDKPIIAIGIVDPEFQKLSMTRKGTSGVSNLSYILFNRSITRDLDDFYRIIPYKKVAIIASSDLTEPLLLTSKRRSKSSIAKIMAKNNSQFMVLPIRHSIADAIDKLHDIDAVYIGYLGKFEGAEKDQLIAELIKRKIPSFGYSINDVKRGVLFATAPILPINKLVRRLALNIEAILAGKNASRLPVHLSFNDKLTLNMATAKKIGYSPKFSVLSEAELINEFSLNAPVFTLKQTIEAALKANLSLKIESDRVATSRLDVKFAASDRYPTLSLNATGTQIDEKRAADSFGKQAERTTTSTLRLEQLIYSDAVLGNVDIQNYLLDSSLQAYSIQKLDIIRDTATTYFNLLSAKTTRNIQKENVRITRQNLMIAKQRELAGYSGRSDVYYWEGQLATDETDYLTAINQYRLVQIQLNQLLHRALDKKFNLQEISLSKGEYANYLNGIIRKNVDTPRAFAKFTSFLVSEAFNNSPEILQINANLAAQQRRYESASRKRYLPTISLLAETEHTYSRGGAGTEIPSALPDDDNWSASINFSWPLYDGGAISIEGKQALTQIMQLKDQLLQLRESLDLSVRANLLELVNKTVNLKSSRRSADFSAKTLDLIQDAYIKGKASFVELSDAQKTLIVSEQRALNSIYEYFSSIINLERAVGSFFILGDSQQQAAYVQRLKDYFKNYPHTKTLSGTGVN